MKVRYHHQAWGWRLARAAGMVFLVAVVAAAAQAKPPAKRSTQTCTSRKSCSTSTDLKPPVISITAPKPGSLVETAVKVAGRAKDNVRVALVEVGVNGGGYKTVSGTTSWSTTVNLSAMAPGAHTLTARARDAAGNVATASVSVTVPTPEPSPEPTLEAPAEPPPTAEPSPTPDPEPESTTISTLSPLSVVADGVSETSLAPVGRGRMAVDGSRTALLMLTDFTKIPYAFVRDASTGASTVLRLPTDDAGGWSDASYALRGDDLWVASGAGPVVFRHYRLGGSPLPTTATLVSTRTFGDADSRPGEMVRLRSGALLVVWHQQGQTGPQGHRLAYRPAGGSWQTLALSFMPTRASKDVVVQHPADGSVWIFSNPDAWSSIGAARLVESAGGLTVSWTDAQFIDDRYGEFDADPENPALAVAPDPVTGELVLAYQSATRKRFSSTVIGSHPAIARIDATGRKRFARLPVYVERVSRLGLVVRSGEVWLAHRPVDPATLRFDVLVLSRLAGGTWTSKEMGALVRPYETVHFGVGRVEVAARMSDKRVRFWR